MAAANTISTSNDLQILVSVTLAALPLGIGAAMATGLAPVAGLLAGVVAATVVGFLGGTALKSGFATDSALLVPGRLAVVDDPSLFCK